MGVGEVTAKRGGWLLRHEDDDSDGDDGDRVALRINSTCHCSPVTVQCAFQTWQAWVQSPLPTLDPSQPPL